MSQYLLSVYYPAGSIQPAPDELAQITRDVTAVHDELQRSDA